MKQLLITAIMCAMATINCLELQAQALDMKRFKNYEHLLDDVMEIIDTTELKAKLQEVKADYAKNPNEINKVRLGIIYHETALNLSFFSKTNFSGYAKKSFDTLSSMLNEQGVTKELLPFITSYRASALSLVSAETNNLKVLGEAFTLFNHVADNFASISYLPEFLRGSVAENLPWFFFKKKKYAKRDFQSIIEKQEKDSSYANWKIMSFTYWAWAKQRQRNKYKKQSLAYLDKAIALDPHYKAARKRSEELKAKLQ
jgi:hypothetical protein